MRKKIGIFGGTFDPIHIGHLRMALELKQQLGLDEMRLLPCHKPPHRKAPQVSSAERAAMLNIALQDCSELSIDLRELEREKPSYTYDTLLELRAELGDSASVVLCMGADAFAGLSRWHAWRELIHLAHIVVVARPEWSIPDAGEVSEFLKAHQGDVSCLSESLSGSVVLQSLRLLPISATDIREQISRGESVQFLVPDAVWNYIQAKKLYC